MITVEKLKKKYPNPILCDKSKRGCYCVGGAFVCEVKRFNIFTASSDFRFPHPTDVRQSLIEINPKLSYRLANIFACDITGYNDGGQFEKAWETLDRALNYTDDNNTDD